MLEISGGRDVSVKMYVKEQKNKKYEIGEVEAKMNRNRFRRHATKEGKNRPDKHFKDKFLFNCIITRYSINKVQNLLTVG